MNKKRYITSVVYVAVLLLLLVFKWLVADYGAIGFDALFCAIAVIGSLEFFNAVKVVPFSQKVISTAFCASAVPAFVICEMVKGLILFAGSYSYLWQAGLYLRKVFFLHWFI